MRSISLVIDVHAHKHHVHSMNFTHMYMLIMPICNCQVQCRGGKNISASAHRQHKKFRNMASTFSAEFGAFIAAVSQSHPVSIKSVHALLVCLIHIISNAEYQQYQ